MISRKPPRFVVHQPGEPIWVFSNADSAVSKAAQLYAEAKQRGIGKPNVFADLLPDRCTGYMLYHDGKTYPAPARA